MINIGSSSLIIACSILNNTNYYYKYIAQCLIATIHHVSVGSSVAHKAWSFGPL